MSDTISDSIVPNSRPITDDWSPPTPDINAGIYPFVSVQNTRSGHVFEVNDTLGHERIFRQHKSGTYEEYNSDGDHVMVVHGNTYKVIHKNDHMTVVGNCNITIIGNLNTVVHGNHIIEVNGNVSETIRGNKVTKIGGFNTTEITGEYGVNVGANRKFVVHGNTEDITTGGSTVRTTGKTIHTMSGGSQVQIGESLLQIVEGRSTKVCTGDSLTIGKTISIAANNDMKVTVGGDKTEKITGSTEHKAAGVKIDSSAGSEYLASGETTVTGSTIQLN